MKWRRYLNKPVGNGVPFVSLSSMRFSCLRPKRQNYSACLPRPQIAIAARTFGGIPWTFCESPCTLPLKVPVPLLQRFLYFCSKGTCTFAPKVPVPLAERFLYLCRKGSCTFNRKVPVPLGQKYREFFRPPRGFRRKYRMFSRKYRGLLCVPGISPPL